jgi:predicted HTH domain antitoxin
MTTVSIPIDEKWLASSGFSVEEAARDFRLLLASRLFELRRLTFVQAAAMAGMDVWQFTDALRTAGISILNLHPDELAAELGDV